MGGILTSVECGETVPQVVIQNPEIRSHANGIPAAHVTSAESDIYRGVWFQHDGDLLEVLEIDGEMVTCSYVEDLNEEMSSYQ